MHKISAMTRLSRLTQAALASLPFVGERVKSWFVGVPEKSRTKPHGRLRRLPGTTRSKCLHFFGLSMRWGDSGYSRVPQPSVLRLRFLTFLPGKLGDRNVFLAPHDPCSNSATVSGKMIRKCPVCRYVRDASAASLLEISRRRTCPFHIQRSESGTPGSKICRVGWQSPEVFQTDYGIRGHLLCPGSGMRIVPECTESGCFCFV
jgi:hypothetical protein